ncbi:hypothetical protein [Georgenia muralis]|uniref:Uncharacterized protein n=1 Tax=Georgenia muralis TaxID=154117 RepID=A0A3N4Z9X6_9MICO|nr:hypothetical protein [Georgenia muralis]RPF29047.1 hypothetical protein EDD32_3602 [Georgenia muralis]
MPTNTAINLSRVYVEDAGMPARRESALRLIHHQLGLTDVTDPHKKEMLSIAIWKWTEAEGVAPYAKYHVRLRSTGALDTSSPSPVNHEHVWQRKWIIEQLLNRPEWSLDELRDFLEQYAVACTVTVEEHARLGQVSAVGWDRYVAAGVEIYDMLEERRFVPPTSGATTQTPATADLPEDVETTEIEATAGAPLSLDEALVERAGDRAPLLRSLLDRLTDEEVAAVVGASRDGGTGDYIRLHDLAMGEPSPAVAYLHWTGKLSVRLVPEDLPAELAADDRLGRPQHVRYGVTSRVTTPNDLDTAEGLILLALEKARAL